MLTTRYICGEVLAFLAASVTLIQNWLLEADCCYYRALHCAIGLVARWQAAKKLDLEYLRLLSATNNKTP